MALPGLLKDNAVEPPPLVNQLAGERGAYYELHRQQVVAWQAWSDCAFAVAEKLNKPILLTIGYAASHWCQDMSRNSFENPAVAALLNENFVNICVDQHERPDIAAVYQTMHLLLNGHPGGWPLTLFLCPKTRLPFIAGTHFSLHGEGEQMGFAEVLVKAHHFYHFQPKSLRRLLRQVADSVEHMSQTAAEAVNVPQSLVPAALAALAEQQDQAHGGFGSSPKFALPVILNFLLHQHARQSLPRRQLEHLQYTLCAIAECGISDPISGGFFRYSSDEGWARPSFEKMLYDNGLLLEVYAQARQVLRHPQFEFAARGIVRWLKRDMLSASGAFFSTVDADIDGCEGDYYLFSPAEIQAHLSADEWRVFVALFGLPGGDCDQRRHLSQQQSLAQVAAALSLAECEAAALYQAASDKLDRARRARAPAPVDRKILVSWNALVIKGLAAFARCDAECLLLARNAVDFIERELWVNQRLFTCWQDNKASRHGFLDDYAYLIEALLELLQVSWRDSDYRLLLALAESMLHLHLDRQQGGLFYTADDAESLIFRPKPFMDSIQPAANGSAARALLRVGQLSGEPRYSDAAVSILNASATALQQAPDTHLTLVQVLDEYLQPMPRVLLMDDGAMAAWEQAIWQRFNGRVQCFRLSPETSSYPPDAMGMEPGEALVCVGEDCLEPCLDQEQLLAQLSQLLAVDEPLGSADSTPAGALESQ